MKILGAFLLICHIFSTSLAAQELSDILGAWKIVLQTSGLKPQPKPTYLFFKRDSSYVWGIDSLAPDPMKGILKGKWLLTPEHEIELIPADTTDEIRYYHSADGIRYKFRSSGKGKNKTLVYMLEMDIYIEKLH